MQTFWECIYLNELLIDWLKFHRFKIRDLSERRGFQLKIHNRMDFSHHSEPIFRCEISAQFIKLEYNV